MSSPSTLQEARLRLYRSVRPTWHFQSFPPAVWSEDVAFQTGAVLAACKRACRTRRLAKTCAQEAIGRVRLSTKVNCAALHLSLVPPREAFACRVAPHSG